MKRLARAPNIAIAQLWLDLLEAQGIQASMQRYFMSSAAGEIPPDQCLPELWVLDDEQLERAKLVLNEIQRTPQRNWVCQGCSERVEGGFEQCWNCGAMMPEVT